MSRPPALTRALKCLRAPHPHRRASAAPARDPAVDTAPSPAPSKMASLFTLQSQRRVLGSPVLPLETVALPASVQASISKLLVASRLTPRHLRNSTKPMDRLVAREAAHERRKPRRGAPVVARPPAYDDRVALAHAITRAPGTLAANVYVMAEVRRCLGERFVPKSVLDFGAGVGVGTMAVARVFNDSPFVNLAAYLREGDSREGQEGQEGQEGEKGEKGEKGEGLAWGKAFIDEAALVDRSSAMRNLSKDVLKADGYVNGRVSLSHAAELAELKSAATEWDVVLASYVLNEVVRETMSEPARLGEGQEKIPVPKEEREKTAEKRLQRKIKELWKRTKEGGIFVIVEDGTAAGFETVSFARRVVLGLAGRVGDGESGSKEGPGANVIAPCMHSKACPLEGSITRHRICRFQQRFNRPGFLRRHRPLATGYEDEYFSYVAIQKTARGEEEKLARDEQEALWGRLIRPPLMKGKHVVLDACTVDGELERRVVSKKNAAAGHYTQARKAKWGDIWPVKPLSKPQTMQF